MNLAIDTGVEVTVEQASIINIGIMITVVALLIIVMVRVSNRKK